MLRRVLIILIAILLFIGIVGGAASYSAARSGPYLPGERFFAAQAHAEQLWLNQLVLAGELRASSLLDLVERRVANLEAALGEQNQLVALSYLDKALNQAVSEIETAPEEAQPALQQRLLLLTERALALLNGLELAEEDGSEMTTAVASFVDKLTALQTALSSPEEDPAIAEIATNLDSQTEPEPANDNAPQETPTSLENPINVPFPEGSLDHDFFPLQAGHNNLKCSDCHTDSTYKGTSPTCVSCHAQDEPHEGQFGTDCVACHDVTEWTAVSFDHSLMGNQDCAACHTPPANHYAGACSACHSDTSNFRNAVFSHATIGGQDCAACHSAPANHYAGACSACHLDTGNFKNANFNHATIGGTDCAACHSAPTNHYAGACSACHQDTGNFKNANFNHATIGGTDCSACHSAPANHFAGACSMCHQDTGNFGNANFNHAGLTDCASCHQPPPNHFAGQCSDCHTTDTFTGASFNHSFPTNHKGANNNCETCHPGGNTSSWTCTNCHSQNEMDDEHEDENGYNNNSCIQCHPDGREPDDDD